MMTAIVAARRGSGTGSSGRLGRRWLREDADGRTRLTQSETFSGDAIPFTGKIITQTETDFRNLSHALKQRVEARR
jgi:hypothetical protein